jgi:hypothetical protein
VIFIKMTDKIGLVLISFKVYRIIHIISTPETAFVVWWLEFLATDPEVPASIPSPARFSEK